MNGQEMAYWVAGIGILIFAVGNGLFLMSLRSGGRVAILPLCLLYVFYFLIVAGLITYRILELKA